MNVAIRTSNIIASLITAVSNADLVFFDYENYLPSIIPRNVTDVFRLCNEIKASGSTGPVMSLLPYYEKKKVFKTFVIVTDEGENGIFKTSNTDEENFASLFKKYYHKVYPAHLIFISFLHQSDAGRMVTRLKEVAPEIKVLQFKFSERRPDLSKLDNVFGLLSSNEKISEEIDAMIEVIKQDDITLMLEAISLKQK